MEKDILAQKNKLVFHLFEQSSLEFYFRPQSLANNKLTFCLKTV